MVELGTLESGSIRVGYGITKAVVIAADFEGSYKHESTSNASTSSSGSFAFAPSIHVIVPGTPLYLGAQFEVDVISSSADTTDETDTLFDVGGVIGAHAFLFDGVSLDPEFSVAYAGGSGTLKDTTSASSSDIQISGFVVALNLGLSAWL